MATRQRRGKLLDAAENPNAETASQQGPVPDTQERRHRIAEAAYYNAERRGFRQGGEHEDWLQAEKQVDAADGHAGPPASLQDDLSSPDHMIDKDPPPMGNPHDPQPGRPRAGDRKKPERRSSPRAR
jgi:hypothetical protein